MATRTAVFAGFLAVCLTVSLLPAGAVGQAEPAVGFGEATTVAAQGDVATVDLRVRNTEAATLRVRAADQSYRADVDVRDGDGDGRIRVRLDTFRGLDADTTVDVSTVDPADDAELVSETTTQEGLVFADGRYNLIAATESTSIAAVLRLEPPTAGGNATQAVPPETPLPAEPTEESRADTASTDSAPPSTPTDGPTTVARGDHARSTFAVSGLGGILERPAPGADLVSAVDASRSARTTHRLRASPTEAVRMRSVTIEYGASDAIPTDVYRLSRGDIETLGVDTTGDGTVDRSVRFAVGNIRTSTDGTVTLAFDRAVPLDAGDTLLASYAVTNPDTTGTEPVSVTLAGASVSHTERGVVRYGPAGQGSLGHGVDARLVAADADADERVAPLAALEATYDPARDAVVVDADTSRLEPGAYTVELSVGAAAPDVLPTTTMREEIRVVEPSVTFTNRSVPDDPLFTVSAETNLAPGNDVVVRVDAQERGGGVSQVSNCVTAVTADGRIGCEFDLTKPASDFAIEVSVARGTDTIGGPVAYT